MFALATKIAKAIQKHGTKAWNAIKSGASKFYSSAKAAWDKGVWAFTKWLASNTGAIYAIYDALKSFGLID